MPISESPVTLILDESYAFRAIEDAKRGPVWLVKSPTNDGAAKELRRKYEGCGDYITVFDSCGLSAEEACLNVIPEVDLHHPELSVLIIVGVSLTPRMRTVLENRVIRKTDDGFTLSRNDDPLSLRS